MRPSTQETPRRQPLVLIADDDADFLRLAAWELDGLGLRLRQAHDGLQAVLRLGDVVPDLVIVDVDMPAMDGLLLVRQIRMTPELRRTQVLVVTGKGGPETRAKALSLGANGYLQKPFDPATFRGVVLSLLP